MTLFEFASRVYHYPPESILHTIPLAQIALLYRQYVDVETTYKGNTLGEDQLLKELQNE